MKRIFLILAALVLLSTGGAAAYWYINPPVNPDPNHTHADFAVYVSGTRIDFAKDEYMSGSSTGATADSYRDPYFHLHDGNGDVVHRHLPGLAIGAFFKSIGFTMTEDCFTPAGERPVCDEGSKGWKMFVNGTERPMDPEYVFADEDRILLTYGASPADVQRQLASLSGDACLYSKTCPWRGKPPVENCVADPKVPCME